jgi:hypothetical protein
MSRIKLIAIFLLVSASAFLAVAAFNMSQGTTATAPSSGDDPDLPTKAALQNSVDQDEYLRLRDEYIGRLHGMDPDVPLDPDLRGAAIQFYQQQEKALLDSARMRDPVTGTGLPAWTAIGPFAINNGQTTATGGGVIPVSGRVTVIVANPTNANVVYLGTAQGGVWRSKDGGTTWVSIFDNAQSQAIGALALAPSNPSILYIGTGEPNLSGDSFFGVGIYRIDNADTTTGALADLKGPINPKFTFTANATGNPTITTTCFGGRSISQIVVHPTDPATIWVGTSTGIGSVGGNSLSSFVPPLALVGVYRSTNATAAPGAVTFQKLGGIDTAGGSLDSPPTGNRRISDLVLEPGSADNLLVSTFGAGAANDGGIYRSTNATAANPTFTQTLVTGATRIRFAIQKTGTVVTVLAATSETPGSSGTCGAGTGQVRKSIDGGVTWPTTAATATTGGILTGADGYCGGQCFYNVTIAMAPNDPNTIYLGGNAHGTCSDAMKKSSNGVAFVRDDVKVHADSHALFITNTTPPIVFEGNDGGIWKRDATAAAGTAWTDLNLAPLNTFQFTGLAVHPTNRNFTIGGTQDNGTEAQDAPPFTGAPASGTWLSAEGGDGGFALIDSNSDLTNITMYHTFFNQQNNIILFDRALTRACLGTKDGWETRGFILGAAPDPSPSCDGTAFYLPNGIGNDVVLFYAPMALGPGNPNTLYFGTDRLYRSTDRGDTMVLASQAPLSAIGTPPANQPITAIAISPQDDNVRLVATQDGKIFTTSTGAPAMTDTGFPPPTNAVSNTIRYIGRLAIDPKDKTTGYATMAYYFNPANAATAHVWKVSNLNTTPVWTQLKGTDINVIPNVPVNAIAIDPAFPNRIFAGTDIGVYVTQDGGNNWVPFGTGLPRVAVFDMQIQPTSRILRIATHGRGMWEIAVAAQAGPSLTTQVSAANVPVGTSIFDTASLSGGENPTGTLTFRLFGPNDASCANTPAFTSVVNVNGNSTYVSGSFVPSQPGTYLWTASYSGDGNNTGVATPCGDTNETVTVGLAAQFLNMSTRMRTDTTTNNGNSVGIGGFTITGSANKHVLIRAIGPSLTKFGFAATDVLADPTLEVHGPGPFATAPIVNNNWRDSQEATIKQDGLAPTNDLESAIDAILPPGAYTAIIKGNTGTAQAGLCLFEVYDLDTTTNSKLANLSTRAFVGTNGNVVIGGFVLGGNTGSDRVVVRGLGPSLSSFGIGSTLADPTLELRDENGTLILANNDWQDNAAQATLITNAGLAPTNTKESAIAATLAPGAYTAILAGLNNSTGVGVVEVYDLGP